MHAENGNGRTDTLENKTKPQAIAFKGCETGWENLADERFGDKCFKHTAYINFDSGGRICRIFEEDYDIRRILQMINIETGIKIEPEETLIIFDEIQEAPKAISSLKYFCENAPEYAVIAAGSLLGVSIHEGTSFPVGKIDMLKIHPLSYLEFLKAVGEEACPKQ